ncbi:MAG: hypothetical protein WC758_06670 [Candidatus Woesearchaeota archaeon]|jgi:hypothetical protein
MANLKQDLFMAHTALMKNIDLGGFLRGYTLLDVGSDSFVYKSNLEEKIIKVYVPLRLTSGQDFTVEDVFETVKLYNSDTLKAKKAVEESWGAVSDEIRSIVLNGVKYDVLVSILPQGDVMGMVGGEALAIGQRYIEGNNLKQIFEHSERIKGFENFYNAPNESSTKIRQMLANASMLINNAVGVPFQIDNKNVKPVLYSDNKVLDLIVTDLADSIVANYCIL